MQGQEPILDGRCGSTHPARARLTARIGFSAYLFSATGGEGAGAYFQQGLGAGEWLHLSADRPIQDVQQELVRQPDRITLHAAGLLRG
jgi:hypothetical protein